MNWKLSMIYLLFVYFLMFNTNCIAQQKQDKFFISAGYGLAGSFFVRSYEEFNPIPGSRVLYKKKFVGVSQNAAIGINFSKNWEARVGINFQHFKRRIASLDTINNIMVKFQQDIHHRDYMWYGSTAKKIDFKKHLFSFGIGLYYLLPRQEEIDILPNFIGDVERDQKHYNLNEGGSFIEVGYEYKFQPKVNLGVKTQFYYTLTASIAESITLFPYVKINF